MVKLGMYYESIINYDMMLKYFLMAFNNGFIEISYNIGKYYEIIKKYEEMKKYYKIQYTIKNSKGINYFYTPSIVFGSNNSIHEYNNDDLLELLNKYKPIREPKLLSVDIISELEYLNYYKN